MYNSILKIIKIALVHLWEGVFHVEVARDTLRNRPTSSVATLSPVALSHLLWGHTTGSSPWRVLQMPEQPALCQEALCLWTRSHHCSSRPHPVFSSAPRAAKHWSRSSDQTQGSVSSLIHVFFFFLSVSCLVINTCGHMDQSHLPRRQWGFCRSAQQRWAYSFGNCAG